MSIKYMNVEEILRIHFQLIEDFGGSHGVRDEGRLLSIVEAPRQIVFDREQYLTIFDKAAVYLRNIIGDHPFTDGNKRTALTVCGIFLSRNGYSIMSGQKELEEFTLKVATEHLDPRDIAQWLQLHSQ